MKQLCTLLLAVCLALGQLGCARAEAKTEDTCVFTYEGTQIVPGTPAAPVLEALGQPASCGESPSSTGTGMDKTYGYGSFYITTSPENGQEKICRIWFADDTVETADGIRIGHDLEQVQKTYPDALGGEGEERKVFSLSDGDTKLSIILEEDVVVNILYRDAAATG